MIWLVLAVLMSGGLGYWLAMLAIYAVMQTFYGGKK